MVRGVLFRPLAWFQFVRGSRRIRNIPLATDEAEATYVAFRLNDAFSVLQHLQPSKALRAQAHLYAIATAPMSHGNHFYMDNFRVLVLHPETLRKWSAVDLAAALVYAGTRAYLEVQLWGYHRLKRQTEVASLAARNFKALAARRHVWPAA